MSRWIDAFNNHQFKSSIDSLMDAIDNIELSESATAVEIEEFARIRKVYSYIVSIIESLDIELVPQRKWDEASPGMSAAANELIAYQANGSYSHLENANGYLDSVIDSVRPLVPLISKGGRAYSRALTEQARTLSEHLQSATNSIAKASTKVLQDKGRSEEALVAASALVSELQAARDEILGTSDDPGLISSIKDILSDVEDSQLSINSAYNRIVSGDSENASISSEIEKLLNAMRAKDAESENFLASTKSTSNSLDLYLEKLLGPANESGERTGGFNSDLSSLRSKLIEFQAAQEKKYHALIDQVETLIPGATSAGLATAYRDMKDSFELPVRFFSRIFFAAIIFLAFGSLVLHTESISSSGIKFVDFPEWQSILRSVIYKLPFYGPAVWLAYYASKRRSEYQRLQQEYAHKEALAKSYDSYRRQIEALDLPDQELMKSLLSKAIDAVSYNASQTLDGRHGDRMPSKDFLDALAKTSRRWNGESVP